MLDNDGNEIFCETIEEDSDTETSSNAYHYSQAPINDYYSAKT